MECIKNDIINFDLEVWENNVLQTKTYTEKVIGIITDPLKINEPKAKVFLGNDFYGIPFSQIKDVKNSMPIQLKLF